MAKHQHEEDLSLVEAAARSAANARDALLIALAERVAEVDPRLYRPLSRYRQYREDWEELSRRAQRGDG